MIEINGVLNSGFCKVYQNENFKFAFITHSDAYSYGEVKEVKRHNKTDEIFVLIEGTATMLTIENENLVETKFDKNVTYVIEKGIWHYLAVSEDAKVVVCENADTSAENTDAKEIRYVLKR